ncbi:unnamed protein product [Ixodes hexagonus]
MIASAKNGFQAPPGDPSDASSMTVDQDTALAAAKPLEDGAVATAGKPRKTRRGKKRRQERPSDDSDAAPPPAPERSGKKRRSQVVIRPRQVPKAPANFTQFIIDDHENCALYQSFEGSPQLRRRRLDSCDDDGAPEVAGVTDEDDDEVVPESSFPAGDHYESLDYGNMVEFYEKDFEAVYTSARVEELLRLPRSEVVEMYSALERRADELCEQLHECDPLRCLDELQRQLLRLQEENRALLRVNAALGRASAHDLSSGLEEEDHVDQEEEEP